MDWSSHTPFTYQQVVSEPDIGGLGHTNNTCFVKWCKAVAWQHSRAPDLDIIDCHLLDKEMAIHKAKYEYFYQAMLAKSYS
jgi:acyl-CoA thioester hydrolase